MGKKTNIIFIFILALGAYAYPQSIREKTFDIIHAELGKDVKIESSKFTIPPEIKNKVEHEAGQAFYSDAVYIFKIAERDSVISIGILDNVYGKSLPMTFIVLYSTNGEVLSTSVVKYREPYGGGVRLKSWNDQFKGKNSKSGFKIGKDIDSISGATISVRSLTKGIKKLTLLFEVIKDNL